ncbi:MAG: ShlB/FhaC/HecB family hemolysin secretion/activation protein, partial [Planctomycetota bacterium]|nr:ShlB/FhaC/HecB family hemolysin secretion/activation protein [Planctomycetota bacterium]
MTASIAVIMNDSDFPEFFMPAIRQMLIVCFALAWPTIAVAQEASDASDIQAMRYATQELKIEFRPSMAEEEQLRKLLMSTPLPLTIREGFIDAGAQDRWSLRALNRRANMSFSVAGIQKVNEGLLRALNEDLGLVGVFVVPKDIDRQDGTDNREDKDSLVFLVITNIIEEVRTLASGTRVGDDAEIAPAERINHPAHNRIRERAPVQPGELLTRESLEAFAAELSLHPGRTVDVGLGRGSEPGLAVVDFNITERDPQVWTIATENTGTQGTSQWRYILGWRDTQLTDRDDVLSVQLRTSGDSDATGVNAGWTHSLFDSWTGNAFFHADQYVSSQFGVPIEFEGNSMGLSYSISPRPLPLGRNPARPHFVTPFFRIGMDRFDVTQSFVFNSGAIEIGGGETSLLTAQAGVSVQHLSEQGALRGGISLAWQGGDDDDDVGRFARDDSWSSLNANIDLRRFVDSEGVGEFRLRANVGGALDGRVAPQAYTVLGGMNTIRGYPEAAAAGDQGWSASVEYWWHPGRSSAPNQRFQSQDWDLAFGGFLDAGATKINNPVVDYEVDEDLLGAGIGLEGLFDRSVQ